jgi:DNA-binding protein HU-beta
MKATPSLPGRFLLYLVARPALGCRLAGHAGKFARTTFPMTKAELIDIVAEQTLGVSKIDIGRVHDAIFATIVRALEVEGRFAVPGFGTFDVKTRAARKGRNPKTGEEIDIAASKTVAFKPAGALKEKVK